MNKKQTYSKPRLRRVQLWESVNILAASGSASESSSAKASGVLPSFTIGSWEVTW